MNKKILCIGEALIDMICTDKGTVLSEGLHFEKKPGGAPCNVAAAIAALGGAVEIAAKVGNDPFGDQLINVMKEFGVSTKWMLKDEECFTTMAFVSLMENGERDFVFNRGADGHLTINDLATIDLEEFSIIHFGSATAFLPGPLQETYSYFLQEALNKNIFISFDPNYRHLLFKNNTKSFIEQSWSFLMQCDFFKMSDEEALLITGCNGLNESVKILSQKTKAVFAITLGEKGALLRLNDSIEIISSVKANVTDTTGAGDAFVGAVLFQLNKISAEEIKKFSISDWKAIISNANKVAAQTCEHLGAMEAFLYINNKILSA